MNWEFQQRSPAGDSDAASKSRIIIEGDHTISPYEVFVREVLQNSLDAALNGKPAQVHFKLHSISSSGTRDNFLKALGWQDLCARVEAANRIRLAREEPAEFGDPKFLVSQPIQVMEITECGTTGLVGPEAVKNEEEERRWPGQPPKAYIALARDDARREKQGLGSGGTYGLGKAVLWAASSVQTVVFFSRLSIPHEKTIHRLAAQARLGPHFSQNKPFRGLGYGGDTQDGWCRPIINEKAQMIAAKLGLDQRTNANDTGTSILIPFWQEPESEEDEAIPAHVKIARYAARYFWPAITDGRLEVTTEGPTGKSQNAKEHLHHYQPFIALYARMNSGKPIPSDVSPEKIHFLVPHGPPPQKTKEKQTHVIAGMSFTTDEDSVREDFSHKVACIRGQGMVVGYAKMTGSTLVRPFVGLALGGRAGDNSESGVRGDVLLGYSEYVTHTRWDEKSASLRHWPTARPVVRELLQKLRDYFERNSRIEQPDANNDLTPLEEGLRFPGPGKIGSDTEPIDGQPKLRLQSFKRGKNKYLFEIRVRVEADKPPTAVDLWIEPAVETGTASREDRFGLEKIRIVPAHLPSSTLPNGKLHIEIPKLTSDTLVSISGSTEELPSKIFEVSEGLLKATMTSDNASQESAPGEEDNHD
ncbi:MAG: hypothetical protein HYV95_06670 [Opitutae bacterium]|nr:hypothetical protein [Opitutae bacterium]